MENMEHGKSLFCRSFIGTVYFREEPSSHSRQATFEDLVGFWGSPKETCTLKKGPQGAL